MLDNLNGILFATFLYCFISENSLFPGKLAINGSMSSSKTGYFSNNICNVSKFKCMHTFYIDNNFVYA